MMCAAWMKLCRKVLQFKKQVTSVIRDREKRRKDQSGCCIHDGLKWNQFFQAWLNVLVMSVVRYGQVWTDMQDVFR